MFFVVFVLFVVCFLSLSSSGGGGGGVVCLFVLLFCYLELLTSICFHNDIERWGWLACLITVVLALLFQHQHVAVR